MAAAAVVALTLEGAPALSSAPREVTLVASPGTVTYGGTVTLAGAVTCSAGSSQCVEDVKVIIEACPHGDLVCSPDRLEIGRVRTDADGAFTFRTRPGDRTIYWARVEATEPQRDAARSDPVQVDVKFRVSLSRSDSVVKPGGIVGFRVRVVPDDSNLPPKVELQRKTRRGWVTVERERTNQTRPKFVFKHKVRKEERFRGFAKHQTFHDLYLPGHSKPKKVRVRA